MPSLRKAEAIPENCKDVSCFVVHLDLGDDIASCCHTGTVDKRCDSLLSGYIFVGAWVAAVESDIQTGKIF